MTQLPKSSDDLSHHQPTDAAVPSANTQIIAALKRSATAPEDAADEPAPIARVLTPEAERALAEAAERRAAHEAAALPNPPEIGGRNGPDPVRYGDWESGGIAWDF